MNKKKRFSGRGIAGGSDEYGSLNRAMLNTTRVMYEIEKGTLNPKRLVRWQKDMIDLPTQSLTEQGVEFLAKVKRLMPFVLENDKFEGELNARS